jgi:hypothetical protein
MTGCDFQLIEGTNEFFLEEAKRMTAFSLFESRFTNLLQNSYKNIRVTQIQWTEICLLKLS